MGAKLNRKQKRSSLHERKFNNRKRTKGRNFYYQTIREKVMDVFNNRIIKIWTGLFWKILLWIKIINPMKLAKRKTIKVNEIWRDSNKIIRHNL